MQNIGGSEILKDIYGIFYSMIKYRNNKTPRIHACVDGGKFQL